MPRPKKTDRHALYFSQRLAAKLKDITAASVTLAEAPSGFGKTTCIGTFMRDALPANSHVVHIGCMEGLPQASWKRLCVAIGTICSSAGDTLQSLGTADGIGAAEAADLLQSLDCGGRETWLVIDDFHHMAEVAPDAVWKALINHRDTKLHVIIMSQKLGELGIYAVGKPGVLYLGSDDLLLSRDDLACYFGKAGVSLPPDEIDESYRWNGGWIAAAQLQLNYYIDNGKTMGPEGMLRLIYKAFWANLDEHERRLMLRLSLLDGFEGWQAAGLADSPHDSASLAGLLDRSAFIRYDAAKSRYYINNSLVFFLRRQLDLLPEEQKREHMYHVAGRCSGWGCGLKAFELYYRLRDFECLLKLPVDGLELAHMGEIGYASAVKDIIYSTPRELWQKYPHGVLGLISQLFGAGEHIELANLCAELRHEVEQSDRPTQVKNSLLGETELVEALLACNDISQMGIKHRQAYLLMGERPASVNPPLCPWTLGMPSVLFAYHSACGKLEQEVEQLDRHLPIYAQITGGGGQGAGALFCAEAHFCRGMLEDAAIYAHRAACRAEIAGQAGISVAAALLLGRIAIVRGNLEEFHVAVNSMERAASAAQRKSVSMACDMANAFLMAELGKAHAVPGWIKRGDINRRRLLDSAIPFAHMVYMKFLLLEERPEQLLGMADDALALAYRHRYTAVAARIMIYSAAAYLFLGRHEAAQAILSQAVAIAAPDRLYAPFAENISLVGLLMAKTCPRDFLEDVNAFSKRMATGRSQICQKLAPYANHFGLTQRERDVVCLAARGYTNPEISEQLFISRNTVKSYMKAAYQKVGVTSRSQLKKAAAQLAGPQAQYYATQK